MKRRAGRDDVYRRARFSHRLSDDRREAATCAGDDATLLPRVKLAAPGRIADKGLDERRKREIRWNL